MTVVANARPRLAVDTNVLYDHGSLLRLLLAADRGLVAPVWSAQVAAELAREMLWRGQLRDGRRSITVAEYCEYRLRVYRRIDEIDRRCEIVRVSPIEALQEEATWAHATDRSDLHLQLLARVADAEYVVSWNHRRFPGRRVVDGRPRGELCGVVWITPDQIPDAQGSP